MRNDDNPNEEQREWQAHPYTQRLARAATEEARERFWQLVSAANSSSDANVREAACIFEQVNSLAEKTGGEHVPQ